MLAKLFKPHAQQPQQNTKNISVENQKEREKLKYD